MALDETIGVDNVLTDEMADELQIFPDREGGDFLNFGLDQRRGEAQSGESPLVLWSKNGGQVNRNTTGSRSEVPFKEESRWLTATRSSNWFMGR
jgi:hypothetical protein